MQTKPLLLLVTLSFAACTGTRQEKGELPFDTIRWSRQEAGAYPYRLAMLQDLIAHQQLHGLNKTQVTRLLGKPDRENLGHLYYMVRQPKFLGFWPVSTKAFVVKLGSDSTVEWRKVYN